MLHKKGGYTTIETPKAHQAVIRKLHSREPKAHLDTIRVQRQTNLSQMLGCQNCVGCIQKTAHKIGEVHLSHGCNGTGNGCPSVHTRKLHRAVQSRFTSAALITKCHRQYSERSGFLETVPVHWPEQLPEMRCQVLVVSIDDICHCGPTRHA